MKGFDLTILLNPGNLAFILGGVGNTIFLTLASVSLGFAAGSVFAFGEVYLPPPFSYFFRAVGEVFRGIPLMLLFLVLYFGLKLPMFASALLGLGIRSAAYQGQIFRSALEAVSLGQLHAGLSLGMTKPQVFKEILLPQAIRIMVPGWSNEFITVLKDTSIAFVIGVAEVMTKADLIARTLGRYLEIYIFIALLYFALVRFSTFVLNRIYEKHRIPGLGEKR